MASGSGPPDKEQAELILDRLAGVYFPDGHSGSSADRFVAEFLSRKPETRLADPDAGTRYKTLVEQIPAVIFVALLGEGTGEAYVSPYIEQVLGFTQDEWLNDPVRWYAQIHPEDRGRWSSEAANLFLTGESLRSIYRVLARDGRVVWFNCEAKMVRNDEGQPWFIHGVAFDISDLKRGEEALQKSHDELELRVKERTAALEREIVARKQTEVELLRRTSELAQSNEDLEQFAWSASHDLQEPVRNAALYSELLRKRYHGRIDAQADFFLDIILDGSRRMGALIRDLLAYAQVSGLAADEADAIDSGAALENAVRNLDVAVRESRACIESAPLPRVRMREVHLQQVFQNLISNAIKYRRNGSLLKIDVSARPHAAPGFHEFSVRDNGPGIEPEYHAQIFALFKRLQRDDGRSGTGLGLAICKRMVERYGGRIRVESERGAGSAFFFTAPAADIM
jgi:PAS domain S-box-containing protein